MQPQTTTHGTRSQRERVSFRVNLPTQITLEPGEYQGDEQHGLSGIEHRYWLTEHRICWLAPSAHAAIVAHCGDANPTALRGSYVVTRRKDRPWDVRPVTDATLTVPAPPQPPAAHAAAPPQAKPTAQPSLMGAALCRALDAALDAERYAATLGRSLSFDTADIRSIAATLYIQARQEAR